MSTSAVMVALVLCSGAGEQTGAEVQAAQVVPAATMEEFERRYIHFGDYVALNQTGATVGAGTLIYQGKYKKLLSLTEFYRAIGKPEVSDRLESGYRVKGWLIGGGLAVGLIAPLAAIPVAFSHEGPDYSCVGNADFDGCLNRRSAEWDAVHAKRQSVYTTSFIIAGAGGVAALIGLLWPMEVPTPEQVREEADLYNQKIYPAGGDKKDRVPPRQEIRANFQLRVSPMVSAEFGGLVAFGQF